ncbi:MAG: TlpA family protein disulfide reductase [Acidobacteriota bacterium]
MIRFRRLPAALAALSILAMGTPGAAMRLSYRVPAPAGGHISDEDFKGSIVVLDIWATWCGPCRMVIPHLVKLQEDFRDRGVKVVGLNADGSSGPAERAVIREFIKQYQINYPVGLMTPGAYREVARVMGYAPGEGMSIPTTMLIARNGLVVKRYPGYFPGQEDELRALVTQLLEKDEAAGKAR